MSAYQLKNKFRFGLYLAFIALNFLGCAHAQKSEADGRLLMSTNWVRSSLEKANEGFRKVNRMSPIVYKDLIITGNALDGLVAFNQVSGQIAWRIPIPHGVEASGTIIKDRLFIGSNNGRIYSIDLSLAQIIWFFDTKSEVVSEPLLQDGIIYFESASQSIFALDAVTGKQLWTYNRQDTANLMTIRGGSKPTYFNGILYAGFSDGSLVSFNAKTGSQQWEITLNKNTRFKDIDSSPVVDGDFIYVNSYDDKLYCVSRLNGEIVWSIKNGGISTPLVVGDRIIYSTSKGELVAVAKKDGQLLWNFKSNNGIMTDSVIYLGFVVAGESLGRLLLLDTLTGQVKGEFEPGRGVFSKPTVISENKSIYFISGEGNAYSVRAEISTKASIDYLRQ